MCRERCGGEGSGGELGEKGCWGMKGKAGYWCTVPRLEGIR